MGDWLLSLAAAVGIVAVVLLAVREPMPIIMSI